MNMDMSLPSDHDILILLDRLAGAVADDLESPHLEFKPWIDAKADMRVAVEYAVCMANAGGGVIVFGVADKTRGRTAAIHGAKGYDLDVWRRGIFDATRPHLAVEVSELAVPEGTGQLLLVRVPVGENPPYGTAQGVFKQRVGKNCMPLDPAAFQRGRIATGALDWSGQPAQGVRLTDLDPVELGRARAILRGKNPESELLRANDADFLKGLGAMRAGQITHTGLLLFGQAGVIAEHCPQAQVHYVYQTSDTAAARNDAWRSGLLLELERIEQVFSGPANPEEELSVGLFKLRVPAFPLESVREAVLNALTHRDYADPGEVLIRQTPREVVVTSPGGFVGGITLENFLRHEPVARNRTLADALVRLRLVEAAGMGRRRMWVQALSLGKLAPRPESDGHRVTLRLFNTGCDPAMAGLVSRLNQEGREVGLDTLLVLSHLREHPYVDAEEAAQLLHVEAAEARRLLDEMGPAGLGLLERKSHTRSATFHLTKGLARELMGKAAYTKSRGLNPIRYAEMVREYLQDHPAITNREVRDLLGLGESATAQVEASRYLRRWSTPEGFLQASGSGGQRHYRLRSAS
jgi:ATP-dependent DNA helicase RecG